MGTATTPRYGPNIKPINGAMNDANVIDFPAAPIIGKIKAQMKEQRKEKRKHKLKLNFSRYTLDSIPPSLMIWKL
jgi:hypothetical protein